jgi:hypothetical protein
VVKVRSPNQKGGFWSHLASLSFPQQFLRALELVGHFELTHCFSLDLTLIFDIQHLTDIRRQNVKQFIFS